MTGGRAREARESLLRRGYAVLSDVSTEDYRRLAAELGHVVHEEMIQLREGAHAYVAKAGAVPFHTDQAQVEIVAWRCNRQDDHDGASLLLDSQVVLARLPTPTLDALQRTSLACPPVAGGPPSFAVPVLRSVPGRELFFCTPWLEAVGAGTEEEEAVRTLGRMIRAMGATSSVRVRLAPGDVLLVDNQRVMHGRNALSQGSPRQLHRLWVVTHETALSE